MSREIEIDVRFEESTLNVAVDFGQVVVVTEGPEAYTGPVTVTPTESEQTLLTKDKLLTDNVTVERIPSEYVIPTGTETISVTENGTVSKDVTDKANVTVNVNVVNEDYDNALVAFGAEDNLTDGITALTTYSNSVTGEQDETLSDAVRSLADGYGSGKKAQGTFAGNNSNKIDIPCNFEPRIIFIYTKNDSAEFGGLYLICIIKDRFAILGVDSDRSMVKRLQYISYDITGYNDPPVVEGGVTARAAQASYSNGVLTVGAVSHSSGWYEFKSEVTFEYILVN